MKTETLNFLEDYKKLCIKHKMEIRGFDDGAYVSELNDEQLEIECLGFDQSEVGMSNLSFKTKKDFNNSTLGINTYRISSLGYKK